MENKTSQVQIIANKLNDCVLSVIGSEKLHGFQKAYQMASAIQELKSLLTTEYMKPIMMLQGNKLGFRTDKDRNGGYPEETVKNCLIEAVLYGLQPTGNHFNIISGNMYPTKEGLGYLLGNFKGLSYTLTTGVPRVSGDKTSCLIPLKIQWVLNGHSDLVEYEQPIKIDQYTSVDAMIGKATRKGRAWLYGKITGTEVVDGEVEDTQITVIGTKINRTTEEIENERAIKLIESCESLEDLDMIRIGCPNIDSKIFDEKAKQLKK